MGELRKYKVRQGGMETVMNLSEEDAKNLYPDAEPVDEGGDEGTAKTRATSNKARTTENK